MILKECDLQKGQIVHIHTSYYPMGNLYKSLKKNHGTGFSFNTFYICVYAFSFSSESWLRPNENVANLNFVAADIMALRFAEIENF